MADYNINLNSNSFEEAVKFLISNYEVDEVIETGTFNGLGSTTVFAKTNKKVISVESCFNNFFAAKDNLKNYLNVELMYGSSLSIDEMVDFIDNDNIYTSNEVVNKQIMIDGDESNKMKDFYKHEITGWGYGKPSSENLLIDLINNDKKQIVFLDSAGGVGYLEFKKFMSISDEFKKNKILLLDDVSHVKHFRSVQDLLALNYKVTISEDKRFAYCIFTNELQ